MLNRTIWARPVLVAILLGLAAIASSAASAQTFPSGTIKLIVPVPAGGVTDTMARIVAQRLTEAWGQSVVVDNRPGGNYAVGAQAVARSPADGLSLLVAPDSTVTANPPLLSKLPYDAVKDLTPIIVLCRITPVLVINPALPAQTVPELIALAKSKSGSLNYGSYGIGTYAHLSMEDFKQKTGTDIVHIPYRGAAPATTALLAGDVSMLLLNLSSIDPREDRQGADSRRCRRQARAAAAGPADDRRGRRAGLLDHRLVRAVGPRQHGAGVGGENPCRRLEGPRPAAVARILPDQQLRAGRPHAGAVRQADRRRLQALGRADQGGRRQARLRISGRTRP